MMIFFKPLIGKKMKLTKITVFYRFKLTSHYVVSVFMNIPFVTNHVGDSGENIPMTKDKMGNTAEIQASVRQ